MPRWRIWLRLQSYYEHDYEGFLAVLRKSRKKLATDPARLGPGAGGRAQALRSEFEGSTGKLGPLQERIRQTDELIDGARLCALTQEKIGIAVKGTT